MFPRRALYVFLLAWVVRLRGAIVVTTYAPVADAAGMRAKMRVRKK